MPGTVLSLIQTLSFNLAKVGSLIPILWVGRMKAQKHLVLCPKSCSNYGKGTGLKLSLAVQALNNFVAFFPPKI